MKLSVASPSTEITALPPAASSSFALTRKLPAAAPHTMHLAACEIIRRDSMEIWESVAVELTTQPVLDWLFETWNSPRPVIELTTKPFVPLVPVSKIAPSDEPV